MLNLKPDFIFNSRNNNLCGILNKMFNHFYRLKKIVSLKVEKKWKISNLFMD